MQVYKIKINKHTGTDFREVRKKAFGLYTEIAHSTKRRPYVRSVYFEKEKIFLDLFWSHLFEKKNRRDRMRRVRYFGCAIELIQKTRLKPTTKPNPNKKSETFYRFYGITMDGEMFCVQIKEDKNTQQKFLVSVFPTDELV
ncbi:MAG: hypothetical protein HYV41_05350 [Candidatus Magasanikbacteria bacterium]|nr:hypothetical protein [Candidatus Magasanikbacteria bacterium]